MSKLVKFDDKGFNNMVRVLNKTVNASIKEVTDAVATEILQKTAREVKKSALKTIKKDAESFLQRMFVSSNKTKVRKAKDGSLIINSPTATNNKWVRVRNTYDLKNIGGKNPAGRSFSKKQTTAINKSLSELRKKKASIIRKKKANIAAGQATFIYMLRKLRLPLTKTTGLAAALKVKLPLSVIRVVDAKGTKIGDDSYIIILKSKAMTALNPYTKGLDVFRRNLNSKVKEFKIRTSKSVKGTAKQFAKRHGFTIR